MGTNREAPARPRVNANPRAGCTGHPQTGAPNNSLPYYRAKRDVTCPGGNEIYPTVARVIENGRRHEVHPRAPAMFSDVRA